MIAATSPRVLERDDPWRWSSSPMLRARASGVWRFSASGVGGGTQFCLLFGTAERNARPLTSRGNLRVDELAMDPLAPSITFYDKETGKGRTTFLGARLRGTTPVTRLTCPPSRVPCASRGSADALSPPAFAPRRQPHPGSALHPHPRTVVHEPRIRGETQHARLRVCSHSQFFGRDVSAPLRPSNDLDRPSRDDETLLTRKRQNPVSLYFLHSSSRS